MSKALVIGTIGLLAICLIPLSLTVFLQRSEQPQLLRSDVVHFNFGVWDLVSSQPKLNRRWQLFLMPIDSRPPSSPVVETNAVSMPEVELGFLLNSETTQSSVPHHSAYKTSRDCKAIGKIVIVERIHNELVAIPDGSCGYLFENDDKTKYEIVVGPFGSSMVFEALNGVSSNGLSSTLEISGVIEGAKTKLIFSKQADKTKVPGTDDEPDTVKTESKLPE